ncbi:membrane-associated guanylate kinase, WW and PDZ domain-containing protein 2-like [Artibeus jamaicensis]|uniref:membrane-associated guanylate kinase, WW and PDZ domain-containing protein 2-like n=1 Tax=Artibeus jamaicensis TaxID=9417 RepID=UPI00235A6483|nr:membrane-associated guanylate kinase, WW and PDZ domain-containing protein 2-like [Artibeus jamaicensis]
MSLGKSTQNGTTPARRPTHFAVRTPFPRAPELREPEGVETGDGREAHRSLWGPPADRDAHPLPDSESCPEQGPGGAPAAPEAGPAAPPGGGAAPPLLTAPGADRRGVRALSRAAAGCRVRRRRELGPAGAVLAGGGGGRRGDRVSGSLPSLPSRQVPGDRRGREADACAGRGAVAWSAGCWPYPSGSTREPAWGTRKTYMLWSPRNGANVNSASDTLTGMSLSDPQTFLDPGSLAHKAWHRDGTPSIPSPHSPLLLLTSSIGRHKRSLPSLASTPQMWTFASVCLLTVHLESYFLLLDHNRQQCP